MLDKLMVLLIQHFQQLFPLISHYVRILFFEYLLVKQILQDLQLYIDLCLNNITVLDL